MAVVEQYLFTVPSRGLCVMCLSDSVTSKTEEVSIKNMRSYLELDYRKVFSLTKTFQKDDDEEDTVDVKVTLCRSCLDLRNKFSGLYEQIEAMKKRLNDTCIQTMLEVMINAESHAIRSKRYRELLTSGAVGNSSQSSSELLRKTIADKFRKETMHKCALQMAKKGRSNQDQGPFEVVTTRTDEEESAEDALELSPGKRNGSEQEQYEPSMDNGNYTDEEEDMKVDEDADPEELMMKYNSLPDKFQLSGETSSSTQSQSSSGSVSEEYQQQVSEVEQAEALLELKEEEPDPAAGLSVTVATPDKSSFNSKYQCNKCGKVVVSLKNFELHQRRHTGEKPFACNFCTQNFRDTSNLRSHTLRYHRERLFIKLRAKDVDDDLFKSSLDRIVQSIVQISEGPTMAHQTHQCYLCHKNYTQKYAIEDHIVQRHYDVLSTAIVQLQTNANEFESQEIADYMVRLQESGETFTVCGLCEQNFKSGMELNAHMKVHVKVQVARNEASGRLASNSLIQLKMKCNSCGRYFNDMSALKRHKDLHQGQCATAACRESVYTCEHCGRSFCSYYSQRSHVLSFHRYQVFSRYLPEGTTSAQIETSVKAITGKYTKLPSGLFLCSLCPKRITQLRKLQSHMLVTHFDEVVMKLRVALGFGETTGNGPKPKPMPELNYLGTSTSSFPDNQLPFANESFEDEDESFDDYLNEGENPIENVEVLMSFPE